MQLHDVRENHIKELKDLDLSGLLRIVRGNWKELNKLEPLPDIMYDYLEAMAEIRNNWAHIHAELPQDKQVINELKVIENFLGYIKAPEQVKEEVRETIYKLQQHLPLEECDADLVKENEALEDENEALRDEIEKLKRK